MMHEVIKASVHRGISASRHQCLVRGLTLLELMLAIVITTLVAGAIAGMLGAVSAGVGTRKDNREIMVLAHAAQCRISAYVAASRCVLSASGGDMTLWLDDSRESGTVHATEIRWLRFDADTGEIIVHFVAFPAAWTPTACELADDEYGRTTNWETVRAFYQGKGLLESRVLVDHLVSVAIKMDHKNPMSTRHVAFDLEFEAEHAAVSVQASGTIQSHQEPVK